MFSATSTRLQQEALAGTGHLAGLLVLADAQKPLPRFDLKKRPRGMSHYRRTPGVESPNIVARLEGSHPTLKDEYVLVSAHLDHLGTSAPTNGGPVFAGAIDDA